MKNLKKVLALVLVVATLMGFATVASAKFSDAESIKYTEAVDVMSMLNVINGYTDGSFRPTASIKRAEMAKMVAYIVAGGEDVGNLYAGANSFSDCTTHWAKGYIAYASKTGIVAGVGGGKFNPEGSVTGTQVAKMLLCALGYDATFESYTGANWAVNVLNRANEIGLLDGLSGVDMSKAMTREQAAQMMFNALTCTMVKYSNGGTTITTPDGTVVNTGASTAEEVANKSFDYRGTDEDDKLIDEVMQLCEKYFDELKLDDSVTAVDAFSRPSNEWSYDDDTVTASKTPAFTYTAGTKASVIAKDMKNYKVDGNNVQTDIEAGKNDGASIVYTDGTTGAKLVVAANEAPADAIADLTANGTSVEIYTNKKNVTDIIVVNTYLAKVDDISKNKDDKDLLDIKFEVYDAGTTVGGVKTLAEQESFDYDEDDYVLVNLADKAVKNVTAPETVEGTAKTQASDYYIVDGTKYSLSAMFGGLNDADEDYTGTYTFYLDASGNIIGATEVEAGEANLQYVWLKAIDVTLPTEFKDGAVKAKLTFMDGTTKTVDLAVKYSKLSGEADKTWNVINPATGEWTKIDDNGMDTEGGAIKIEAGFYTYTVNSENGYTLKKLNADYAEAVKYTTPDKVTANVVSGYSANSSTKLVMVDANKTYTGYKNFPTTDDVSGVTNKDALAVYGKGSTTLKALYVMADEAVLESVTYAYSTSDSKAYTEDGEDYYKFYVDGEIKYYQITGSVAADTIYKLDISDGVATPTEITADEDYKSGQKYNAIVTSQTVTEVSGEDYFKIGETLYYLGYDKDDAVCGIYDLDNDGAKDTISKDDKVTIVSITVDEQNYALAVYIEAE